MSARRSMFAAGFRSTRRTKIICTIGPKSSSTEMLATLAAGGMNVARLNMSHGDHEWHKTVIDRIRKLNKDNGSVHRNMLADVHMITFMPSIGLLSAAIQWLL